MRKTGVRFPHGRQRRYENVFRFVESILLYGMAKCNKCGFNKPESEFNFNKTKGRIEYHCKQCHSEYLKQHYAKNKGYYKDKANKRKEDTRAWMFEFKSQFSCSRCGQNHPAALDFHHQDPNKKDFNLGEAVNFGWSKEKILEEAEKCSVLCASCHRIHHWEEKHGLSSGPSTETTNLG